MDKKKLSKRMVLIVVFIFLLNLIASKLYWYTSIWWLDMLMHFLGGFWLGLLMFFIFFIKNLNSRHIIYVFLGVLLVGILWELFELLFFNYLAGNPVILLDTLSDIFFDLAGGGASIIYFSKRIMTRMENII